MEKIAEIFRRVLEIFRGMPQFLGALANLRNATISYAMSLCRSVRMEKLGSHWTDCHEV
jgi:hypothetical protein